MTLNPIVVNVFFYLVVFLLLFAANDGNGDRNEYIEEIVN